MKIFTAGVDQTTLAFLNAKGFAVVQEDIETAEDLHEFVDYGSYDALVADLDVVNWGIFAVRYLRSKGVKIPFVGITVGDGETQWSEQRSLFLENGGDDLLRSPASPRELAATLRACVRRDDGKTVIDIREFHYGKATVRVNLSLQSVTVNGLYVHLTGKEMKILSLLVSSNAKIVTKEMLLTGLYTAIEDEAEIKIIDVFVCKVRKKLNEMHPDAGKIIATVWGRGYQVNSLGSEPGSLTKVG